MHQLAANTTVLTLFIPLAVLLAGTARPATASVTEPSGAFEDEVQAILRRPVSGSDAKREAAIDKLVDLGPEAIPALFAVLVGDVDSSHGIEEGQVLTENALEVLQRPEEILFEALGANSAEDVTRFISGMASAQAPIEHRLVGLRVLGHTGDPSAVPVWLKVVSSFEPIHLLRTYVQNPAEDSLAGLLAGSRTASAILVKSLEDVDRPVLPLIARAIGRAQDPEGLDVLERLLGVDLELDLLVVDQISELAEGIPSWRVQSSVSAVREFLTHPDWRMRRSSVVALGKLHDVDAFESLISVLEDENRRVRLGALWSLQKMSGLQWEVEDTARWRTWYTEQEAWQAEQAPIMGDRLMSPDASVVLGAVRELSTRRLFKHEVSELLVSALTHESREIVQAVCVSLGTLQSSRAVPYLIECLQRPDATTRQIARNALFQITDKNLPADYDAWKEFSEG